MSTRMRFEKFILKKRAHAPLIVSLLLAILLDYFEKIFE